MIAPEKMVKMESCLVDPAYFKARASTQFNASILQLDF